MTHSITIVGLGNHSLEDMTLGVYRYLKEQSLIYARTLEHPVINELQDEVRFEGFDHLSTRRTNNLRKSTKRLQMS